MQYQQFEDLPVWQRADELNAQVLPLIRVAKQRGDYAYADQLRRASLSITNNIAEGFERKSGKEFLHFLSIAKGSAGEVRSMLSQAVREEMLGRDIIDGIRATALDVSRQLARFIKFLQKKST